MKTLHFGSSDQKLSKRKLSMIVKILIKTEHLIDAKQDIDD